MKKVIWIFVTSIFLVLIAYYFYTDKEIENGVRIDKIIVYKSKRELSTYANGSLIKTFKISIGKNSIGKKEFNYCYNCIPNYINFDLNLM